MKIFITGTDTDAGKTFVTVSLLNAFNQMGLSTLGLKPVSAGSRDDAFLLQKHASIKLDIDIINPFAFAPPIAPHIAAAATNCNLNIKQLHHHMTAALEHPADICLIEGAGGWLLPLNSHETMADYVIENNFPIVLVVGMRLGCLNHALLTAQSMQHQHANTIGWIANCIDPNMDNIDDNISTLINWLPMPFLGRINHKENSAAMLSIAENIFHFKTVVSPDEKDRTVPSHSSTNK